VLVVDDDPALRRAMSDRFRFWGHDVTEAKDGGEAVALADAGRFDLVILDLSMPGLSGFEVLDRLVQIGSEAEKVVLTAHGSLEKAVEAMKRGADDFLAKPADFALLERIVARALDRRRLERANRAYEEEASRDKGLVRGTSPGMARLLETAERAAASDTTLLICGESGTGKQVLAEYVHRHSPRRTGPFVYVNCVAISDELIESTLFGHEKGAFTGAVGRKPGKVEAAAGGTAFLDEVGDISPKMQTKLLHFLETGEFERIGGSRTLSVDCRVIAATNRDLKEEVEEGRFRNDLYFRLNVIALPIPPLRERSEDIGVLAESFLGRYAQDLKREQLAFAPETLRHLAGYAWPGNVRQLRNAIERMAVLAPGDVLTPDLLPPEILDGGGGRGEGELESLPLKEAETEFRRRHIRRALERANGNQGAAARALGIQRTTLNQLMGKLNLR